MTTPWMSGGEPWAVTTDCAAYATDPECEAAHLEAVRFWQGQFPPDP